MAKTCKDCGKKRHPTLRSAIHAAVSNSVMFGRAFRTYRCPSGNGWHLTTKPDRRVAA